MNKRDKKICDKVLEEYGFEKRPCKKGEGGFILIHDDGTEEKLTFERIMEECFPDIWTEDFQKVYKERKKGLKNDE